VKRIITGMSVASKFIASILATSAMAHAIDKPIRVHIETHEPGLASSAHLTIDGKCFSKKIELRASYSPPSRNPEVAVRYRGVQKRFGSETVFVRDLFSGKAVLQYFIVCAGTGFQLTAWGTSFDDHDAARFIRGLVTFDENGRVADYDISTETYPFIRDHLR
jgi:hypothetical protein